jgi:putative Mn2+ efflux pump MntP
MPLTSYWLIEGIGQMVGVEKSADVGNILSLVVTWLAFALLLFIGSKMILEGSKRLKQPEEEKVEKVFSYKELFVFGVATAIDALAVGISLHSGTLSNNTTIWLHVSIIMVITFALSLIGVVLGSSIVKLFKGKQDLTSIIGGVILLLLAVWVVVAHYVGI